MLKITYFTYMFMHLWNQDESLMPLWNKKLNKNKPLLFDEQDKIINIVFIYFLLVLRWHDLNGGNMHWKKELL